MWWQYLIIAAVILLGIYGFLVFTRFETRNLSRRTSRTAADLYPHYAGPSRRQRRDASQSGGQRASGDGGQARDRGDDRPPGHGRAASGGPASGPD